MKRFTIVSLWKVYYCLSMEDSLLLVHIMILYCLSMGRFSIVWPWKVLYYLSMERFSAVYPRKHSLLFVQDSLMFVHGRFFMVCPLNIVDLLSCDGDIPYLSAHKKLSR
jgi:hypothetical protein